jgi:RNA recognition motif-containing protein
MGTKLYVGNLAYGTTADQLRELFEADGRHVADVSVVTDRTTGQSRGFGFVEMASPEDAQAAVSALDGRDLDGRTLRVSEARERSSGGGGGGYGGGGGRGGGFGGGGRGGPGGRGGGGRPRR